MNKRGGRAQISNRRTPAFYMKEEHTSLPCCPFPDKGKNAATEIGEEPKKNPSRAFLVLQSGREGIRAMTVEETSFFLPCISTSHILVGVLVSAVTTNAYNINVIFRERKASGYSKHNFSI